MAALEEPLDLALAHLQRRLGDQLHSIDALSSKTSVTLGFVLATLAALVGLDRQALLGHAVASAASFSLLVVSSVVRVRSSRISNYNDPPDPVKLLRLVDENPNTVGRALLGSLAEAVTHNQRAIFARFHWVNAAMDLYWLGVIIYAVGVGLT